MKNLSQKINPRRRHQPPRENPKSQKIREITLRSMGYDSSTTKKQILSTTPTANQ